jgi:hypothetical protein
MDDAVRHVLVEAREQIERFGWLQKKFTTDDGARCMSGAVFWAKYPELTGIHDRRNLIDRSAIQLLGRVIMNCDRDTLPKEGVAILVERWNDQPGRTEAEVLRVFDQAIALYDKEKVPE